ncbi:MAG: hypothetical protein AB8B55_13980 [Mariniblastus sp.]
MSNNPYQSPCEAVPKSKVQSKPGYGRVYINQVAVVSTLMLVQGALLLLVALILVINSVMFTQFGLFDIPNPNANDPEVQRGIAAGKVIMFWVFGGLGAASAMIGILHIIAGILGFQYRGRRLTIFTLCIGLVSMLTCYCAPTAIALMVYGLIIFMHPSVKQAFEMKKSGLTNQEIQMHFTY